MGSVGGLPSVWTKMHVGFRIGLDSLFRLNQCCMDMWLIYRCIHVQAGGGGNLGVMAIGVMMFRLRFRV